MESSVSIKFESIKQGLVEAIKLSPNTGQYVATVEFSAAFLIVGLNQSHQIRIH